MKKLMFRPITALIIAIIMAGNITVMAHPGHNLYDVHQYNLIHYLSNPYHLLVSLILGVVLFLLIMNGRRFLKLFASRIRK